MEKIVASYRLDPVLADWIKKKAIAEERKITTVLERIIRDAQERDAQSEKETTNVATC